MANNPGRKMKEKIFKRNVLFICIPLFVHALLIIFFISYTPDDTYIHLQFVRNLLRGQGFSFNAGEPTYGSTSPLWVFVIAFGGLFSENYVAVSKVLSVFFAFGAIVLFAFLARMFLENLNYAFACSLVWSVDAWFLRWAPSGMETSLALFLLLLSFLMYTKEGLTKKGVFISPVIIALLTLVRPEAVLLYVIFLIDFAVCIRANPKKIVFFVIPYLALLAPW